MLMASHDCQQNSWMDPGEFHKAGQTNTGSDVIRIWKIGLYY